MQKTTTKIREKFERKLEKSISKSGGISIKYGDENITAVLIAEPKELYAVDNVEMLTIDAILQEVSTGKLMIHNREFGLMSFDFDFVGSLEECEHYMDELGSNEITLDELLKGATHGTLKLLLKRAEQHEEEIQEEKQPLSINEDTTIQEFINMVANNKEGLNIELKPKYNIKVNPLPEQHSNQEIGF